MEREIIGIYFLIGLIYALVNGLIRKIDTDGDFFLPFVWITLWPICLLSLFVAYVISIITKIKAKKVKDEKTG